LGYNQKTNMIKRFVPYVWYLIPLLCIIFLIRTLFWPGSNSIHTYAISDPVSPCRTCSIDETLPHREYKKIEDSIKRGDERREWISKSSGSGGTAVFIGIRTIQDEIWNDSINPTFKDPSYYLVLAGYKLNENISFFIDSNRWYIKYVVWNFISEDKKSRSGYYAKKRVPFRFSRDDNSLLIPITKTEFYIVAPLVLLIGFAILYLSIYLIIGLPIRILRRISKGRPFCQENIDDLHFEAAAFIALPFLMLLVQALLYLCFRRYMLSEVAFDFDFSALFWSILVGVIVLIIARAFNKGYKLQEEQALTI
jgi:hypothetical protein